jgi:hypothetical protein
VCIGNLRHFSQELTIIALLKSFIAATGLAFAAHAAAQVAICKKENFLGQCFSSQQPIGDFSRYGFDNRASSAELTTGHGEVCEASRLDGHCLVLRQGRYLSLAALGLNDPVTTVSEEGYIERSTKVSSTCLVAVARNRYSVPCELAGQRVRIRLYPNRVEIASNETIVASHARLRNRGNISYDWQHYIALVKRKPGAFINGALLADMAAPLLRWRQGLSALIDSSSGPAMDKK